MAKCRECYGQGFIISGLLEEGGPECATCSGSGEVSDIPSHFTTTGAMSPPEMNWMDGRSAGEVEAVKTLIQCRKHLLSLSDTMSAALVTTIEATLDYMEVPIPSI